MDILPILNHDGYSIDRYGNVYSFTGNKLKARLRKNTGYYAVVLYRPKKSYYIHRLVGIYFVPNPDNKPELNHKDGIKKNNRWDNLEWVNHSENEIHSYRELGKQPSYGKSSLCIRVSCKRDNKIYNFESINEATRVTGYSRSQIKKFINRSVIDPDGYYWYNT